LLANESACTLKIAAAGGELRITDRIEPDGIATCRQACGARGSVSDFAISRDARRPIRYMKVLKGSREFAEAVEEFKRTQTR
jgi:hypothetical protein